MNAGISNWTRGALCHLESSAPDLWTSDRRPRKPIETAMAKICGRCPVRQRCAETAVESEASCGMYAGVYVPDGRLSRGWGSAMEALERIAAGDPRPGVLDGAA